MYAIMRLGKLKSLGAVAAAGWHNERQRHTPNADPERQAENVRLAGTGDWLADVQARLVDAPPRRKDAILAIEHVLTASRAFFDDDREKVDRWVEQSMAWLAATYGRANVVTATFHRDELVPHIHAAVVPVTPAGRLNAHAFIGGDRTRLAALQDSYHAAVAELGLERGTRGSTATHESVKEWYAHMDETLRDAQALARQIAVEMPPLLGREQWSKEETARVQEAVLPVYEAAAVQTQHWQQRAERAEATAQRQSRTIDDLKAQTAHLREMDLADVLHALGGARDPHDRKKWHLGEEHIGLEGGKFYNYDRDQGGGGAIDLVMHTTGYSFREAVGWLRERVGVDGATGAALQHYTPQLRAYVEEAPRPPFRPPERHEEHWPAVRAYLVERRGLPAALVDALQAKGRLYADGHQNAVFLRQDEHGAATGAYLRGTRAGSTFKGLAPGTRRDAGYLGLDIRVEYPYSRPALVLVESPIDALAYAALHPDAGRTRIISTDGAGALPARAIARAQEQGWAVIAAFDRDRAGEKMAARLTELCPAALRETPDGAKDWAECLERHNVEPKRASARERPGREGLRH